MRYHEITQWLTYITVGFLAGSIMFSQWIPEKLLKKDVSGLSDDHNPGATNVFIHCGWMWGLLCLSLDLMKGYFPVYFAEQALDTDSLYFAAVVAAPVLGHAIAPLNHFHGGKCIATAFGSLLALLPLTHIVFLLAGIYIAFSSLLKINPNRLRSIAAFGLFGLISAVALVHSSQYSIALGCMIISLVVIIKHTKMFVIDHYNPAV